MLLHGGRGNAFLLAATNACQWVRLWALSLLLESTKVKDRECYPQVGFLLFQIYIYWKKSNWFLKSVSGLRKEIFSPQLSFSFQQHDTLQSSHEADPCINWVCQKLSYFQRHPASTASANLLSAGCDLQPCAEQSGCCWRKGFPFLCVAQPV